MKERTGRRPGMVMATVAVQNVGNADYTSGSVRFLPSSPSSSSSRLGTVKTVKGRTRAPR